MISYLVPFACEADFPGDENCRQLRVGAHARARRLTREQGRAFVVRRNAGAELFVVPADPGYEFCGSLLPESPNEETRK